MPGKQGSPPDAEFEVIREMVNGLHDIWDGVVKGTWRQFGAMQRDGWPRKLGYASFEEFAQAEFGGVLMVPRAERQEAVAELTAPVEDGGFGLSNRKAAEVLGIGEATVRRDLDAPNDAPTVDLQEALVVDGAPNDAVVDPVDELSDEEYDLWEQLEAGQIIVVNLHTHGALIDLAIERGLYVRIDRRTDWGNPFEMPGDGDRDEVVYNYEHHYLPFKPSLRRRLHELEGKALGCWCAPEACHGDVLKQFAEAEGDADA